MFGALFSSVFTVIGYLFWIAVFAGFIFVGFKIARRGWRPSKNEQAFLRWAAADGWTVVLEPEQVSWAGLLPGRKTGAVRMLLSRTVGGRELCVADYRYSTRRSPGLLDGGRRVGPPMRNHHYVAGWVRLPAEYPPVTVGRPDRLGWIDDVLDVNLDRLADRYLGPRQVPSGDPEFDARFALQAYDPAAAFTVVGPALRRAMLAGEVPTTWQVKGADLVTWRSGSFTEPQVIVNLANGVLRVAELIGR